MACFFSLVRGGGRQTSLMLKIVIVQWMNTAFIIYFINSISEAPNEDYINQVRGRWMGVWRRRFFLSVGMRPLIGHDRLGVGVFCVSLS